MIYHNTKRGIFLRRVNRFIAVVIVDGIEETVHVKNTGRCKELLIEGAEVTLQRSSNPERKTKYDLISVFSEELGWVNIDSSAPNTVVAQWLQNGGYTLIKPEYTYGSSRFDFYMQRDGQQYLLEVKGCTLQREGIGFFPDAPTLRGVKHLDELAAAAGEGYCCAVGFVIQMNGISEVRPNTATHPEFAVALQVAKKAGVEVIFYLCDVEADSIKIVREILSKDL